MAKIKKGICDKCGKPVYAYTGKHIPAHIRPFTSEVDNFICDIEGQKVTRHCSCHGVPSMFDFPE